VTLRRAWHLVQRSRGLRRGIFVLVLTGCRSPAPDAVDCAAGAGSGLSGEWAWAGASEAHGLRELCLEQRSPTQVHGHAILSGGARATLIGAVASTGSVFLMTTRGEQPLMLLGRRNYDSLMVEWLGSAGPGVTHPGEYRVPPMVRKPAATGSRH
jgi:hypothetical protein